MRRPLLLATTAALAVLALAACTPGSAPVAPPEAVTPAPTDPTPDPTGEASGEQEPDAVDPADLPPRYLLATESESDGLVVVDPTIRAGSAVVDRVEVGPAPWGVAVHAPSMRAFVATAQGVAVVDLATRERTDLIPYRDTPSRVAFGEYRRGGMGIAVSPDGGRVHVAVHRGDSSTLETIDVAAREVVASTPVGLRPFDVLVSADGSEVYTVDHDAFSVHVVDATTFEARRIEVAPFGTEGGLASSEKLHYAVLDDDGSLLLPYQGRVLVRLDPATGEEHVAPLSRRHETVTTWTDPATGALAAVLAGGYTQAEAWDGATVVDLATLESYEIEIPGRPQVVVPLPEGPAA